MDIRITEGTYSRDNHEFSLCTVNEGAGCWVAWSAYEAEGSRSFVRFFDGEAAGGILPLSVRDVPQLHPVCLPTEKGVSFVWYEKNGMTYSICRRGHDGDAFTEPEVLVELPDLAKPGALDAVSDLEGSLWLTWAQAVTGKSTIEILRVAEGGQREAFTLDVGSARNYRPHLSDLGNGSVYLVWDAYVERVYDVYGCRVPGSGPSAIVKISSDREWESKAAICRDRSGQLNCVWVRWKDAMWQKSVIHQKFSIRGARFDGDAWQPLTGNDGNPDIASLHYGLLTDFDRAAPALGYQGRRLHPMLKATRDGIWLFYETKADDAANTTISKGRLVAQRFFDGEWSDPVNVAEELVYYELPHNAMVGSETFLVGRDIDSEKPDHDVDELHLIRASLSEELPRVPAELRTIDLTHWDEIDLPLSNVHDPAGERTRLTGKAHGKYQLIWGDFHVHSVGSVECEGELDQLAHYARDKACIHALTISDNDHFWSCGARKNQRWLSDAEWDENVGNAKAINEPGRFAMFPGYEQTINAEHGSPAERLMRNHTSVMGDDDDMERDLLHFKDPIRRAIREGRRLSNKDIVECVQWAREKGYHPLPHAHSNWWRLVDPAVQTACDVTSAWMRNIEQFDIYRSYLDQGMKFGFTGSSDTHYRNPGFGGALTGLWVTDITRAAVLDALRARRTYATAGQRILVEFGINDTFMGDTLVIDEDPVIRWHIVAEDGEAYTVRALRDGNPIHERAFTGESGGEFRDEGLMHSHAGQHYYRLEIISAAEIPDYPSNAAHAFGGRAWSSPIWLETADWLVS